MPDFSKQSSKKKTEAGTKARQRNDTEDRSLIYRDWRREVGKTEKNGRFRKTGYTSDLDQVEYIFYKNEVHPIAIFELTRYDFDEYDGANHSWAKYRSSILDRYFLRDAQGKFIQTVARKMELPAFIILFRNDLEAFWIFDLMHRDAVWERKDAEQYKEWLADLRTQALEKLTNGDN
jgi:hypothetical protein